MKLLMKMNRYLLPKENAGALPRLESGTVFPERIEKKITVHYQFQFQ